MSKVYIIQAPARRSGPRGVWVEKYDLRPAEKFGELVRVLDYGNVPMDPRPTRAAILERMVDFDPDNDYVLLLGDPVACAQAVHALALEFGIASFRVLKWDRRDERYVPYVVG